MSSEMGLMVTTNYDRWCIALFCAGEVLFLKFNRSVSQEREARISFIVFIYSFITVVVYRPLSTQTILLLPLPCMVASSFI